MNKTFKLLTALFALVAIAACQKEPDAVAPATIEVETTELSFTERGETLSIDYTIKNAINGESLTATTEAEWVTVAVEADKLNITAKGNFDDGTRTAEVTLSYKSATDVTLTLTQGRIAAENPIEVELVGYDATTITISVLTADPTTTWIPMVTYKESWDYYKGNQNDIFQADLEYFQYLADINDLTLAEFLAGIVGTGSEEAIRITKLTPDTEFVVYVYGISLEGERTTDIIATHVKTEPPHEGDITFEFSVKEEDFVLEYTVIPSHTGVDYFCGIMSEEELNHWKLTTSKPSFRREASTLQSLSFSSGTTSRIAQSSSLSTISQTSSRMVGLSARPTPSTTSWLPSGTTTATLSARWATASIHRHTSSPRQTSLLSSLKTSHSRR